VLAHHQRALQRREQVDDRVGQALEASGIAADQLVLFGDGVEADAVPLSWGQTVGVSIAQRTLNLLS